MRRGGRSASLQGYWRQVHEVQRQTGISSADARRAVAVLRADYSVRSAHATRGVTREGLTMVREAVEKSKAPYADLDDWIESYETWDGDYIEYDVETGVDY
jgi:hypothetical protein